jgi:hypothetical protein
MKRTLLLVLSVGCLSLSVGAAEKASQTKVSQEKQSYIQKANQEVQDWAAKIKALEDRSQQSGTKTRQELDQRLKKVNENLVLAQKKLEELRNSGENAWKNLRDGLDKALEDIKHHYNKAATTLDKDKKK